MSAQMIKSALTIALLLAAPVLPAMADAVDGTWCAPDGRSLTVDGIHVRTPSGADVDGEYSRHAVRYVGLPDDPEAGHDVRLFLRGDDVLRVQRYVEGVAQPEETWTRCEPMS